MCALTLLAAVDASGLARRLAAAQLRDCGFGPVQDAGPQALCGLRVRSDVLVHTVRHEVLLVGLPDDAPRRQVHEARLRLAARAHLCFAHRAKESIGTVEDLNLGKGDTLTRS